MDRLFLVHGMGFQPDGWEKPLVKHLGGLFGKHSRAGTSDLSDLFQIIPIQYDVIFRNLLARWQDGANTFGAAEVPASPLVNQLTGWLRDAGNDQNRIWTHPVDVLLYRFFAEVRQAVKDHVAAQFAKELVTLGPNENWSVVAHSMGTAVTHDSLDMLFVGTIPAGAPPGFDPRRYQAQAIVMLANVSRVLQTASRVYESNVMPGPAGKAGRGCLNYVTSYHHLDPFTWVDPFRPVLWPDKRAVEDGLYQFIEVDHIYDWNLHDGVHYLRHPRLFVPVLRALTFPRMVTKQAEADAIAGFRQFGSLSQAQVIAIKSKFEDKMPHAADWTALIDLAEWYFPLLKGTGGGGQ